MQENLVAGTLGESYHALCNSVSGITVETSACTLGTLCNSGNQLNISSNNGVIDCDVELIILIINGC